MVTSRTPLNKTKAAFLLTCEKLFLHDDGKRARRVYMWTFTFPKVVADEIAMKCWNHLNSSLKYKFRSSGEIPGVKTVEVHPGGHGLHFHALIARRLPVHEVRRLAIKAGFGRIHVQKCKRGAAEYCAKYLTKKDDGLKKGTRRWGMIGGFKGTRVKDIIVESELAENCRRVRQVLGFWSREVFIYINRHTAKYGPCLEWPDWQDRPDFAARPEFQKGDGWLPDWAEHFIRPVRAFVKTKCSETGEWYSTMVSLPVEQPF